MQFLFFLNKPFLSFNCLSKLLLSSLSWITMLHNNNGYDWGNVKGWQDIDNWSDEGDDNVQHWFKLFLT